METAPAGIKNWRIVITPGWKKVADLYAMVKGPFQKVAVKLP
jgi:hypothetical protein